MKVVPRRTLLTVLLAAAWLVPGLAPAQQGDIRLGTLIPITGGGAASGLAVQTGTALAVKEINDAGGILGRKLTIVQADYRTDPTQAVTEARRLATRENVHVIVGPTSSQDALAVAPVLNEAKVPNISSAGSMALTPQVARYGFSMLIDAETQGRALLQHAADVMKVRSIAVLTDSGANSKALMQAVKAAAAQRGIKVSGTDEFELSSTDMTPQLLSLRRTNPDVLIVSGLTGDDMGYVIKGADEVGWPIKIVGSTTVGMVGFRIPRVAGPNALKGDRVTGQDYKAFTYCPADAVGSSPVTRFEAKLKAFSPDTAGKYSLATAAFAYDAVQLYKAAMEGTKSTDGEKIAAWIEENAGKVKAISGNLTASKNSHFLMSPDSVAQVMHLEERRSDGLRRRAGC